MSAPWMPFYVNDYLADTSHLSTLEHGAYMLLIMHYWKNAGLPDDEQKLARICRMTSRQWETARATLVEFFGEGWTHSRIDKEIARATEKSERRAASGQQGGIAKALKSNKPAVAKARTVPEQSCSEALPSSSQPTTQEEESTSYSSAPKSGSDFPKGAFPVWYEAYPRKKDRLAAERAFDRVKRSGKVTWAALLAATKRFAAQPHDQKFTKHPATWLNAGSWNDEPDRPSIATNRPDFSRSPADQVISATRRRVARLDPGGWAPSEGGFDFNQDAEGDDSRSGPVVIDHDGQKASGRGDDSGFSTLFLPSADGFAGSH